MYFLFCNDLAIALLMLLILSVSLLFSSLVDSDVEDGDTFRRPTLTGVMNSAARMSR